MYFLLVTALILLATLFVIKYNKKRRYFDKWGIPHPQQTFLKDFLNLFDRTHLNYVYNSLYNLNEEAKYIGYLGFSKPVIVLRDLDLIKTVMVKNFDNFAHHDEFLDEEADPLFAKNLAFLNDDKWREIRNLLSPAFTSSKMRAMYSLMFDCSEKFVKKFLELCTEKEVDVKDTFSKYTNDIIVTCAFGIEINTLENPNNHFYLNGKKSMKFGLVLFIKFVLTRLFPSLKKVINVRMISKEGTEFFVNAIESTVKSRKENGITRPDMLQLLIDAQNTNININSLEMAAHAFIFYVAGFETTANLMCMMAQELATNPDVQEKLQAEIDEVMEATNGKPTYEAMNNMPYLDAVLNETLRMHPMPFVNRMCSKDFELPPALPGGKPYLVRVGDEIHIPMAGIHYDPKNYENPKKFDPERFIKLGKRTIVSDPTSLGFGLGPRGCIGNRFAILETKCLFAQLLHKCSFEVCEKTCLPLVYDKEIFVPMPKGGTWLKINARSSL